MVNKDFREKRTRVIFNLPFECRQEEKAINRIINYLQEQRIQRIGLEGFTYSLLKNAVFRGCWWSAERQQWINDKIVIFIIDYNFGIEDPLLIEHLRRLKEIISQAYRTYGRIQEEIWLVSHSILRYA